MTGIHIRPADILSEVAGTLIGALNAELGQRYPEPGTNHFRLDPKEVSFGRGAFLVAYHGLVAVGCGAVRRIAPDLAEIKRMYVSPAWRGRGVGRSLLTALEEVARSLGVGRLVLETGERQPEAMALYERFGFRQVPAYGEYMANPLSVCMGKEL